MGTSDLKEDRYMTIITTTNNIQIDTLIEAELSLYAIAKKLNIKYGTLKAHGTLLS